MSLLAQRHLRTAVSTPLIPLQSSPMPSAAWLLSYGVTTFSAGRSVPMAALSRVRTLHMAHPTIASDLVPEKLLLPQKRVTFIGAPFCEGQNLIGSDLAPMAIRKAGLQAAAAQLGWEWDDDGDLDWACEVSKERLLKKCRKETLQSMCSDFGVPTSGSKEQLADILSEQLHAETDDEAGEEDE